MRGYGAFHKTKEHVFENGVELKGCSRCKAWLPLSAYSKDKTKHDGLHGFCKECVREIGSHSYQKNKQKKKELVGIYLKTEKGKAVSRASAARRRSAKLNTEDVERITAKAIVEIVENYNGCCAYCGIDCRNDYNIDHKMPLSRGGTDTVKNLALSCPTCNKRKHTRTDVEFCGHTV